jgi:hypothetical protein
MIDPSRLAADAEMARRFPELPYFAIRPPWLAARHFNADFCVVSCASGHVGYYRRTFRAEVWSGLRSYPKVNAQVVCVGFEFAAGADLVEARYPSFRSTRDEREILFRGFALTPRAVAAPLGRVAAAADARA